MTKFSAPSYSQEYVEKINARCINLIKGRVWEGLRSNDLTTWLNNFSTQDERYFSARVLDSIIYRSQPMIESLSEQIVTFLLPDLLCNNNFNFSNDLKSWKKKITSQGDTLPVRFVAVEDSKTHNQGDNIERLSAKSGQEILRNFKKSMNINSAYIIDAAELTRYIDEIDVIVFLDDMLGTGDQFSKFIKRFNLENLIKEKNCYYLPHMGHKIGVDAINKEYPTITISPVEYLNEESNFFYSKSGSFRDDNENSNESAYEFYKSLMKKKKVNVNNLKGYGDLGLTVAFRTSTPNNSLKLLYTTQGDWNPLFVR